MKARTPKRQAKYVEDKILNDNKLFYDTIVENKYPKRKKRVKSIGFWTVSTATVVSIALFCVFLLPVLISYPGKGYLQENEVTVISDLFELNSSMKNISIVLDSQYSFEIRRTYDSKYNDDLYFIIYVTGSDTFENVKVHIYVNPLYERQKQLTDKDILNDKIGNFYVNYKVRTSKDQDGIYTFYYEAKTTYEGISIYMEYEQLWFEDETNFFNFFEKTIQLL